MRLSHYNSVASGAEMTHFSFKRALISLDLEFFFKITYYKVNFKDTHFSLNVILLS